MSPTPEMQDNSELKGKHNMLNVALKNVSEINEKLKDISLVDLIFEIRELNKTCDDLKAALGKLNEPSK
jgi:hypothetical protein